MFGATCLAILLRHKLHEKLPSVYISRNGHLAFFSLPQPLQEVELNSHPCSESFSVSCPAFLPPQRPSQFQQTLSPQATYFIVICMYNVTLKLGKFTNFIHPRNSG